MTTHPNACEERLDAHAFLWRPFHPPQFAAGDFMFSRRFFQPSPTKSFGKFRLSFMENCYINRTKEIAFYIPL